MSEGTAQPLKINKELHFLFKMLRSVKKIVWFPTEVCAALDSKVCCLHWWQLHEFLTEMHSMHVNLKC